MTTTVRTIFSINATDRSHDFLVIRRGPAGISIEAQSREDEWESATAGPFTPEQLRAALDEVAPAGSYTPTRSLRNDRHYWQARAEKAEKEIRERGEDLAELPAGQRRPVTADDIESVLHSILPLSTEHLGADDIAGIASDLYTALTEPPRPEGAEELARLIADADVGEWDCGDLADALLATGRVRVVTEEDPR